MVLLDLMALVYPHMVPMAVMEIIIQAVLALLALLQEMVTMVRLDLNMDLDMVQAAAVVVPIITLVALMVDLVDYMVRVAQVDAQILPQLVVMAHKE